MKEWLAILCMVANCVWRLALAADSRTPAAPDIKLIRLDGDSSAAVLIAGTQVALRKGEANG